jgi:ABC-type spermidine/putrescine transport system permease subunit II
MGFEQEEVARPEFVGTARLHPITGEPEEHYAPEKRQVKFYFSVGIALICTVVVGSGIALVLALRYFLIQKLGSGAAVIPGILNGVMIAVFNAYFHIWTLLPYVDIFNPVVHTHTVGVMIAVFNAIYEGLAEVLTHAI